jgi:hypothetical protein
MFQLRDMRIGVSGLMDLRMSSQRTHVQPVPCCRANGVRGGDVCVEDELLMFTAERDRQRDGCETGVVYVVRRLAQTDHKSLKLSKPSALGRTGHWIPWEKNPMLDFYYKIITKFS